MKHLKSLNEHAPILDPVLKFYYEILSAASGIFNNLEIVDNEFIKSLSFTASHNTKFSIVKYHNGKDWLIVYNSKEHHIIDFLDVVNFLKQKTDLDRFPLAEMQMWQKALELDSSLFLLCPTDILKQIKPHLGNIKDIGVFDKD